MTVTEVKIEVNQKDKLEGDEEEVHEEELGEEQGLVRQDVVKAQSHI